MFQFSPFPPDAYVFSIRRPGMTPARLPHSDIRESLLAWQLVAAYRSQTTSFVGFRRQIIHHALLVP